MNATDAKLALDTVRRTGAERLEGRLIAAFVLTDGLPLLHRYFISPEGEPIGLGLPFDILVGKDPPQGHGVAREGRTWAPWRLGKQTDRRDRGKPRSGYLPQREAEKTLVRAWGPIWLYVREQVRGMPLQGASFLCNFANSRAVET